MLAGAMALAGCGKKEEEKLIVVESGEATIDYELIAVVRGDVVKTVRIPCTYKKNREQEVFFPVSGKLVDRVYVREGDTVKRGDLLVELSAGNLSDQIKELEYRIERNELLKSYIPDEKQIDLQIIWLNYLYGSGKSEEDAERRDENLKNLDKNVASQVTNYDDQLEFDRKKLESLKAEYAASRIYAKFNGTVKFVADNLEGSTSNIETLVMTLVDDQEGYFETSNNEYSYIFGKDEIVEMAVGYGSTKSDFQIVPLNYDKWEENGKMTFSVHAGDIEGIAADSTGEIRPVLEERDDVLTLPKSCVYKAGDDFYVYIVNEDGIREVKFVTTGLFGDEKVEITGGIEEGEMVIRR